MRFFLMSWFILSLLSKPLWASEEGQLKIGAASKTSSNIYAGASNETRFLPDLKYSKGAFAVGFKEGVSYQLSLLRDNRITVSVVPRFKPYDSSDSVSLAGMSRGHTVDFGVYDNEVKAGRAAYNPGAALVPYVGISSFYKFSDSLSLYGSVSSQFLPSKLTDSPIVSDSNKTMAAIGLSYSL